MFSFAMTARMRASALSVTTMSRSAPVITFGICSVVAIGSYYAFAFTGVATGVADAFFFFQSPIAARIASSASTEQWIFTGGKASSFTMSVFLMVSASSTVLPFTHSVASEEEAMA